MHRAIAQCYQLEEVSRDENNKPVYDKVKSEFGINLRVKPREVTGSLLRWCQGCLNIKDVIANLKAKEAANPTNDISGISFFIIYKVYQIS